MCPIFQVVNEVLNGTGFITDPWSTSLVTVLQTDFVPLTTALWPWLFRQFSVHLTICFCSLHSISLSRRTTLINGSVRSFTEVKINIYCLPLICQAPYSLQEATSLVRSHFASVKSMLTTPSHHLTLTVSRVEIASILPCPPSQALRWGFPACSFLAFMVFFMLFSAVGRINKKNYQLFIEISFPLKQ